MLWKGIQEQWTKLKFLQTDDSFKNLCPKAHAQLIKVSQELSIQLDMLTHKPVLKVASEENISKASSILKVLNRIDSKTNLYVIEKRAAYPRLYLLSNDDTLAALRNEEDVICSVNSIKDLRTF